MSESLPTTDPGTQKRRSTRVVQAVPITVSGVDALGQPFKERTTTVMVNCHGCKYQSKHYVPKNSVVTLEIPRMEPAFPPRIVPGHVVWVQRPRTVRELFQIGLEFEVPGNVWGIAFPPEDWIPSADEPAPAAAATVEEMDMDVVVEEESESVPVPAAQTPTIENQSAGGAPGTTGTGEAKIHVMPSPTAPGPPATPPIDAQLAVARQMAKIVAEAKETLDKTLRRGAQTAITEEMANIRQQLDAQMHETIEHAIKASMERVSEAEVKKVIHQAANKTAAIVEEARLASEANLAQIDAKVRDAVQQALGHVSEQAASHASTQAASIAEEARRAAEANLQVVEEKLRKAAEEAASQAISRADEVRRAAELNIQAAEASARKAAQDAATQAAALAEEARRAAELNIQVSEANARKVAQEAAAQAAALAEETRRAAQMNLQQLEERAAQAAREAANQAVEQAVRQTVGKDLRHSVEELVGQVIKERESQVPSLQVLASPDAARAHVEEWTKTLEHTAQGVRKQMVEQSHSELDAAYRKWRDEFEAMLEASTAKLGQKLSEASLGTLTSTENDMAERKTGLRLYIDEMTSAAQASIRTLDATLAQERTNAEQAKLELQETAKVTLERTRREFDELIAAQQLAIKNRVSEATSSAEASVERLGTSLAQERTNAEQAKAELQETAKATLEQTRQEFDQMIAAQQQAIKRRVSEVTASAEASIEWLGTNLAQERANAERAKAQLEETAKSTVDQTRRQIEEIVASQHHAIGQRAESLIAERIERIDPILNSAAQKVIDHFWGDLDQKLAPKLGDAQRIISEMTAAAQRAAEVESNLDRQTQQAANIGETVRVRLDDISQAAVQKAVADLQRIQGEAAELQNRLGEQAKQIFEEAALLKSTALKDLQDRSGDAVQQALQKLGDVTQQAERLQETIRGQVEQASGQVALIQHAARERLQRESEATVEKAVAELAFAGQEVAGLQDAIREQTRRAADLAAEAGQTSRHAVELAAHDAVQKVLAELQSAATQAAHLQNRVREEVQFAAAQLAELDATTREQARVAAEQAAQESLDRMREQAGKFPDELELTCRATITKLEEELEQKSSEMQHSAYEALLKSSEWYQKKAQTNMQSTMERVIEQSSNALTEKAGEVSSMVAAELDHYRRSYVDHSRSEIDEIAKEILGRERLRLNETAEIANATLTDRVRHLTHESLRQFQEASREALEKSRDEMKYRGDASLERFAAQVDEKMTQGVEQAATYLQSQLMPLLESWEAKRQAEKREWMEQIKKSSEESIDSYKARLENTTNGWLLASAATLGQNSQAVLDSLSKNAEKRMRETCSRVLASMGDTLKERLMGISAAFGAEEDFSDRI